ncbi:hypothetical protein [Pseudomonas sp. McL0111]|uniref:hypothetical protein n=1 Tax=Pseudomonas sp. McL0111 TaxID=3457357 RepID=UPI00403E59B4
MNDIKIKNANRTLTADICYRGSDEKFTADSDISIVKLKNYFYLQARMDGPSDDEYSYLSFTRIAASLANDGKEVILPLKMEPSLPTEARANYDRSTSGGMSGYGSRSGELRIHYDWAKARMWGNFHFEGQVADTQIEVSNGQFDLTGISDGVQKLAGRGTFKATSASWGTFNANEVGIELKSIPGEPAQYWELVGRMDIDDAIPPKRSHIAVFLKEHVSSGEHNLKDNDDVWVSCYRPLEGGFFHAIDGTLTLEVHPQTGHAKGRLVASFMDEETPVLVNGEFDICNDAGNR